MEEVIKRAEKGDVEAQYQTIDFDINEMCEEPDYDDLDDTERFEYCEQAAKQGDVRSQYNLGIMYYIGMDTEKDISQAIYWLDKVAQGGCEEADFCLGCIYYSQKEYKKALNLFLKAAKGEWVNGAAYMLGYMYENGIEVERDCRKAIEYFKKGAKGVNMASYLSTQFLKEKNKIQVWSELGYNHSEICQQAKRRLNYSWEDLMLPVI